MISGVRSICRFERAPCCNQQFSPVINATLEMEVCVSDVLGLVHSEVNDVSVIYVYDAGDVGS